MMTFMMMAMAAALAITAYSWRRGMAPDVERIAGRMWADASRIGFAECPRQNGFKFWMGCTDQALLQPNRKRS
jgi:hypothetical protein